jgi:hypothetical protein
MIHKPSVLIAPFCLITMMAGTAAQASCSGSLGRGWASGQGNGQFEMTTADKTCLMGFANFLDDAAKTRVPATEVALTKAPENGTIGIIANQGLVYTPNANLKGTDRFCTRNTTPQVKGKTLSGCVNVTVR